MKKLFLAVVATLISFTASANVPLFATIAFAKDSRLPPDTRMVGVVFHKGADTAHIVDEIKGAQPVMYRFKAVKGQSLVVELRPKDQNTEFILFAPGKWPGTELHDSAARSSRQYSGQVNQDGMYAVLVSRSAGADKGEPARFDLTVTLKKAAK